MREQWLHGMELHDILVAAKGATDSNPSLCRKSKFIIESTVATVRY